MAEDITSGGTGALETGGEGGTNGQGAGGQGPPQIDLAAAASVPMATAARAT